jgi:hypothetical protein
MYTRLPLLLFQLRVDFESEEDEAPVERSHWNIGTQEGDLDAPIFFAIGRMDRGCVQGAVAPELVIIVVLIHSVVHQEHPSTVYEPGAFGIFAGLDSVGTLEMSSYDLQCL